MAAMPRRPLRAAAVLLSAAAALPALAGCGTDGPRAQVPTIGRTLDGPAAQRLLDRHAPVLRYDDRETVTATDLAALLATATLRDADNRVLRSAPVPVDALRRIRPGTAGPASPDEHLDLPARPPRLRPDVAHGRAVRFGDGRVWLQYWLLYADNPQDRGIVRTGRHEGDWELVQVALHPSGRPRAVTVTQHRWAETCAWSRVRTDGGSERPVVWVANGSHASYLTPGEHGRPWPDPDDEARGDGTLARPRVVVLGPDSPAWLTWPGRWGASDGGAIPGEQASPRGPAFQPGDRWYDPYGLERHGRRCGSGAPARPVALAAALAGTVVALLLTAGGGVATRRRRRSRATARPQP